MVGPRGDREGLRWQGGGIQVVRIKPAASGQMLDLRYRIIDAEEAGRVLKQNTPVSLVNQQSGRVLTVPTMAKVGKLRNLPRPDGHAKLYWIFFGNPGGEVTSGSKVTLVIGDLRIKDITVE